MTALNDSEDPPPNETPVDQRKTIIPTAEVNAHLIAMRLSQMTESLKSVAESVVPVSEMSKAVTALQNQHDVTLQKLDEIKGTAILAGNIAAAAKEAAEGAQASAETANGQLDRIAGIVQRMALSLSGINERTKSLYDAVFPERDGNGHDPEIETEGGELLEFRRRAADSD